MGSALHLSTARKTQGTNQGVFDLDAERGNRKVSGKNSLYGIGPIQGVEEYNQRDWAGRHARLKFGCRGEDKQNHLWGPREEDEDHDRTVRS